MSERDPVLRRIERDAVLACAAMAAAGALLADAHVAAACGVMGGGVLAWISYRGIKSGVEAVGDIDGNPQRNALIGLVKFFTRYGILVAVAYVIMARLHLTPVAVIAGASSLVVAIMLEAGRSFRHNPPRNGDGSESR